MLIGIATLISILFFGGIDDYFLVDKLEKGVKKHVIEKERRKEILADLKESKKYIKEFNKSRKAESKLFKGLNVDPNISKEEFDGFFDQLMKERKEFQKKAISDRVRISNKIEADEWSLIIAMAEESVEKKRKKEKKKIEKGKNAIPFEKTIKVIEGYILNEKRKKMLLASLNDFIESQKKTVEMIASMNVEDHQAISNNDASIEELTEVADMLNVFREKGITDLITFHFAVKDNTNDEEFVKIMKTFNKELAITAH